MVSGQSSMDAAVRLAMESPSHLAALAKERLNSLPDDQIVYIDRLGPRILAVPPDPVVALSRQNLRELNKGNLAGCLGQGARFPSKRMVQCPEITVHANGHYTVKKNKNQPEAADPHAFTVETLDVWTGKPGEPREGRDLDDLVFYSVTADELPTYHSWRGDQLERRESSLELERLEELALAEQEFAESPKTIAEVIDEYKEKLEAKMDEAASNDPENMLRFIPDILPSDPAWEGVEEYFKWILSLEREESPDSPRIYRLLQDEFIESQQLLAIPAINSGYRAKIQDENTKRYHEALQTTFRGRPDNLVTKLTMLCFGLPIKPLTIENVKFAGGLMDVPAEGNGNQGHGQIMERIVWSETPLEFLDRYNERSYGYPMIRTAKRKYEEVDNETMELMLAQAQERSKHPRLFWDECGFPEMEAWESGLHLRGGAGSPAEPPKRSYTLHTEMGIFIMNFDNLNFHDSYLEFENLIRRLYQLDTREEWTCQLDLIPILLDESERLMLDTTRDVESRSWHQMKRSPFHAENYEHEYVACVSQVINPSNMCRFWVRYNPNGRSSQLSAPDPQEPRDNRNIVNLELVDVGIAYWYLPSSGIAVNIRQETFRNAIECLIPHHRKHLVRWSIDGTAGQPVISGQLLLIDDAPSRDLWNATMRALRPRNRITINLELLEDRVSPAGVGENSRQVGILIPGYNIKGWYERNPDEEFARQNTRIFPALRAHAQTRTNPDTFPLRIWSGVENYDDRLNVEDWTKDELSMVLPNKPIAQVERDIWLSEGLADTWDAVVVRPEINEFMLHCLTGKTKEEQSARDYPSAEISEAESGLLTLDRFRAAVRQLLTEPSREQNTTSSLIDFNVEQDYISIQQTQSDETFWIGPGMTQHQWYFQVYSWLNSHNIYFQTHRNWPVRYAKATIEGPLGPISSGLGPSHPPPTPPKPTGVGSEVVAARYRDTPPLNDDPHPSDQPPNPLISFITGRLLAPLTETPKTPEIETSVQPVQTMQSMEETPTAEHHIGITIESPLGSPIGSPTGGQNTESGITPAGNEFLSGVSPNKSLLAAYQEHRREEAEKEQRRVEAYTGNDSIHRDGQPPEIPQFGPPLEGNIPVAGGTVPTIFTAMATPTEIVTRDRELDALEKIALERLEYCGVCQAALPAGPHNLDARKRHFQDHKDIEDEYKQSHAATNDGGKRCPFERCNRDLTAMADDEIVAHLQEHIGWDDYDICPIPDCSMELNGFSIHGVVDHLMEHIHDGTENNMECPFEECGGSFRNLSWDAILTHFNKHFSINRRPCPVRGCARELFTMNDQELRTHFQWHFGLGRHLCPFVGCGIDLRDCDDMEFRVHFDIHYGGRSRICPFTGCGANLADLTVQAEKTHLHRHIYVQRCPFSHCRIDLYEYSSQRRRIHVSDHLGPRRGPGDHRCPVEGCRTYMRAWTETRRLQHYETHFITRGQLPPWASSNCPFENCSQNFTDLSRAQITQHLKTHQHAQAQEQADTTQGGRCQLCVFRWDGVDEEVLRAHFHFTHYPDDPTDFVCPLCTTRFSNTPGTAMTHYRNHVNDLVCTWEGCHHQHLPTATANDRKRHLLTHVPQVCQWPDCVHIAPTLSTAAAIAEERREHLLRHVRQLCPWTNCDMIFPENVTQRGIEQHLLHEHILGCQWPSCHHRFLENGSNADIKFHYRNHVRRSPGHIHPAGKPMKDPECQWPNCAHDFDDTTTSEDIKDHYGTHLSHKPQNVPQKMPDQCSFPGCGFAFPPEMGNELRIYHISAHCDKNCQWPNCPESLEGITDNEMIAHYSGHALDVGVQPGTRRTNLDPHGLGLQECQWPDCRTMFSEEPTNDEIIAHYVSHSRDAGIQPARRRFRPQDPGPPGPGLQGDQPPRDEPQESSGDEPSGVEPPGDNLQGDEPQGDEPQRDEPLDEDQDNIPDRLRQQYPELDFYCPNCLHKVSGGNASACRRHRKAPCDITGHNKWLIGAAEDRRRWQVDRKRGIDPTARTSGAAPAPKNPSPKKAAPRDAPYRPPPSSEDEEPVLDPVTPPSGARRRRRKRAAGDVGGDGGGDGVGARKKQKKKKGGE